MPDFEVLHALHPVLQATLAEGLTWLLTAIGAAGVIAFRQVRRRVLDTMLGFAAGVTLYVVVEIVPETDRGGHIDVATLGLIAGLASTMALDHVLS